MFGQIFGSKKEKMVDMAIYWDDDVTMDDLMDDLNRVGQYICKPSAFEKGCRIMTVKNWFVNDTLYKTCELYVDEKTCKTIANDVANEVFKAAKFTVATV